MTTHTLPRRTVLPAPEVTSPSGPEELYHPGRHTWVPNVAFYDRHKAVVASRMGFRAGTPELREAFDDIAQRELTRDAVRHVFPDARPGELHVRAVVRVRPSR